MDNGPAIVIALDRTDAAALASAAKPLIQLRNAGESQLREGVAQGFGDALAGMSVAGIDKLLAARAKDVLRSTVNAAPVGRAAIEAWLAANPAKREIIVSELAALLDRARARWPEVKAKVTLAQSGGAA
ncbi:hypothetical protein EDM80_07270 [bacterium]|nr:MAG: hypothetical protein EDM80_07270 [bacterium]RIK65418.1 MAG: hypothetical protein DCC64_01920 [Planctomycetota bacterium]